MTPEFPVSETCVTDCWILCTAVQPAHLLETLIVSSLFCFDGPVSWAENWECRFWPAFGPKVETTFLSHCECFSFGVFVLCIDKLCVRVGFSLGLHSRLWKNTNIFLKSLQFEEHVNNISVQFFKCFFSKFSPVWIKASTWGNTGIVEFTCKNVSEICDVSTFSLHFSYLLKK